MNDNEETISRFTELVLFIRNQSGEHKMPITRDTLIEDDLGVTGEDASDLIESFSKKYNVNIDNFIFTKYFYDEPGIFNLQSRVIEPFKVGFLEKAIIAGKLDEEIINS